MPLPEELPPLSHLTEGKRGCFIVVEGNIGCGKSTFCEGLSGVRENSYVFSEPVEKPSFRKLLGWYYKEPGRWGFTFQMYALKERFKQHTLAAELSVNGVDVIQDRSIYADGCFGRLVFNDGNMSPEEWEIYADTFGAMKRFLRYPDLLVYLRASPETCLERVKERERKEEVGIPLDYLQRLHEEHEALAEAMSRFTRVVILDWSDYEQDLGEINKKLDEVLTEEVRFIRDFNRL